MVAAIVAYCVSALSKPQLSEWDYRFTHDAPIACLGFGHNRLVAGCYDGSLVVWNQGESVPTSVLNAHNGKISAIAFSRDRRLCATAGFDQMVKVWNLASMDNVSTYQKHTGWVLCLDFADDGTVISGGGELAGEVHCWDARTGHQRALLRLPQRVTALAAIDSDSILVRQDSEPPALWDVSQNAIVRKLDQSGLGRMAVAYCPVAKAIAVGDLGFTTEGDLWSSVAIYNTQDWSRRTTLRHHNRWEVADFAFNSTRRIIGIVYSPHGSMSGNRMLGEYVAYDLHTAARIAEASIPCKPSCIAYSPHGKMLAVGGKDTHGGVVLVKRIE